MSKSRNLLPGLFMAACLVSVTSIVAQTNQPASPTVTSTTSSGQAKGTDKSSTDQSQQSPPDQVTPDGKAHVAQQPRANSAQAKDDQAKEGAQANDSDDKDESPRHKSHIHLGTIGFGVGYTRFPAGFFPYYGYGPYAYGFGPFYTPLAYGYYDPFYGPYYSGMFPGSLGYGADKGEVKLSATGKGAQVYLNGAFAGPADKLKSMWLEPGAYDLAVSSPGQRKFEQRIYVISGKTLKIRAQLNAQ